MFKGEGEKKSVPVIDTETWISAANCEKKIIWQLHEAIITRLSKK